MTIRTLLPILLLASIATADAQLPWEQLREPYGGFPYGLLETEAGVFVHLSGRGVYLSDDDAASWQLYGTIPIGIVPLDYRNDTLLGHNFGANGIYYLTGKGDTLARATTEGLTGTVRRGRKAENGDIYLLTTTGLHRSTDFGSTWEMQLELEATWGNLSFDSRGDRLLFGIANRAWFSDDRGASFREITDNFPNTAASVAFDPKGNVMAAPWGTIGLWRSLDDGRTFDFFSLPGEVPILWGGLATSKESDGFYLSTISGRAYFVSNDGLVTRRYPMDSRYGYETHALASGTIVIADLNHGLWRLGAGDETFVRTGMPDIVTPQQILRGPRDEMVVMLQSGYAFSSDEGETWSYRDAGLELWINGQFEPLGALHVMRDGSVIGFGSEGSLARWSSLDAARPTIADDLIGRPIELAFEAPGGAIIAQADTGTYRSTDGGRTFTEIDHRTEGFAISPDDALWSVFEGSLYVSRDDGATFVSVGTEIDSVISMTAIPDGGLYLHGVADDGGYDDRISFDNGQTWTPVVVPCLGSEYQTIEDMGGTFGLGAITDCGAHYWDPAERKWQQKIIELPDYERSFPSMFHTDTYLIVGGPGGLWRIAEEVLSVGEEGESTRPTRLDLSRR